jgi:peptidoglycan/LPS O-acetylase OafA/YrhL
MTNPDQQRDLSLDTIRGLAILLVLIGHYAKFAPYEVSGRPAGSWFTDFGQGGVLLFFMLSGYLIWATAQGRSWPVFLVRRLAKIFPAYWVNVIFVFAAGLTISFYPAFSLRDMLGNLLMLQPNFGISALSGVYWTLILEVKFYLLFAIIFYSPLRVGFWLAPVVAAAINLGMAGYLGRSSLFLTYLPVFFIGAAISAVARGKLSGWMIWALAAVAISNLAGTAAYRPWAAATFLLVNVLLFLIIFRSGWGQRHLASLGVISYSVYLYHTTLGYPLLERFGPAFGMAWLLLLGAVVAMVLLVSWLSYRQIELRFVGLGRKLEPRVSAGG